jgi:hypothetical protein
VWEAPGRLRTDPLPLLPREYLLAFSCRTRNLCPSCQAKRAALLAEKLSRLPAGTSRRFFHKHIGGNVLGILTAARLRVKRNVRCGIRQKLCRAHGVARNSWKARPRSGHGGHGLPQMYERPRSHQTFRKRAGSCGCRLGGLSQVSGVLL